MSFFAGLELHYWEAQVSGFAVLVSVAECKVCMRLFVRFMSGVDSALNQINPALHGER